MPELIPSKKFLKDIEVFRSNQVLSKKIAKALSLLEKNPFHSGLNLERIVNDPTAWSVRVDKRYRISFEPEKLFLSGNPTGLAIYFFCVFLTTMIYINIRGKSDKTWF